jgi:hypothetical protein
MLLLIASVVFVGIRDEKGNIPNIYSNMSVKWIKLQGQLR